MGTTYDVVVNYRQMGDLKLPPSIAKAGDHIDKMSSAFNGVASAAGAFGGIMDSIGRQVLTMGVAGVSAISSLAVAGFGAAAHELFKFNAELETTAISLAAVANSTGQASDLGQGLRLAGEVIKEMRKDAKDLPGEFKDLQNIMGFIEPAMANAGADMFSTEKMASQAMAAAAVLRVPFTVAGREISMMLAGNAKHSMPMFTKLGFTDSKGFNSLSQQKRVDALKEKLEGLAPAIELFKNSWEGIRSTAIDRLRAGISQIGGPLFEHIKERMGILNNFGVIQTAVKKKDETDDEFKLREAKINKENQKAIAVQDKYISFAMKFSDYMIHAFDSGEAAVRKWAPAIYTFLGTMERGIERILGGFSSSVGGIGDRIYKFLNDPGAFKKIEALVEKLIVLRVGAGALETGSKVAGSAMSAIPGIAAMAGTSSAGVGAIAAEAFPPLIIAVGLAAVAAAGFAAALTDTGSTMQKIAKNDMKQLSDSWKTLCKETDKFVDLLKPLAELLGVAVVSSITSMVQVFSTLAEVVSGVESAFRSYHAALANAVVKLFNGTGFTASNEKMVDWQINKEAAELRAKEQADYDLNVFGPMFHKKLDTTAEGDKVKHKEPPTNHTTIHKVEIKVDGDADPQRVAKLTVDMLMNVARNPTKSQGGPPRFDGSR